MASNTPSRRPTHRSGAASLSAISTKYGPGSTGGSFAGSGDSIASGSGSGRPRPMSGAFTLTHSPTSSFSLNKDRGMTWAGPFGANGAYEFETTQNKTFCKWLNTRIEPLGCEPLTDLGTDFADGTRLIQVVEALTGESLGRYNREPVMRVQKAENVILALERIKSMKVQLTNIGPEDIMDGNRKLILGMIWLLVLRFHFADINEEGAGAKEGLLLWCQRCTQSYEEVTVQNFSRSFQDGLAFAALIHRHRPDLIDYDALPKDIESAAENTKLVFRIAEDHLKIPRLLDVEDVCGTKRPDERSIMTYVAQFYHAFSSEARQATEAKIINEFVTNTNSLMIAIHDYEERATAFMDAVAELLSTWAHNPPAPPYTSLKSSEADFVEYKQTTKRGWIQERGGISALLGHIQTKLRTYGMKGWEPAEGMRLIDLDERWTLVLEGEAKRWRTINAMIRAIKEELRVTFAALANEFQGQLQSVSSTLGGVTGPLEDQLDAVLSLQRRLDLLASSLVPIASAEQACVECNVEENDYTVYSYEDLAFEFGQLSSDVLSRKAFIDNQSVARTMTNVTPEKLEEFESAFRAFDKDYSNTLDTDELTGALRSLGVAEQDIHTFLSDLDGDEVSFELFIRFLVEKTSDRLTPAKVRGTFGALGGDKGYVTELDLSRLNLPASSVAFLQRHMPEILADGEEADGADDEGRRWDFVDFLDALLE